MSSNAPSLWRECAALALLVLAAPGVAQDALPGNGTDAPAASRQTPATPTVTAREALDTARDAYAAPAEQTVTLCPQDSAEDRESDADGDTIVVCRRLLPAYQYQTRDGPSPRLDRTADGVPRAPDFDDSCLHTRGRANCNMGGYAPPPVLMVDVSKFPEPLSPEDAARVMRAPDDPAAVPAPLTGERVPIP